MTIVPNTILTDVAKFHLPPIVFNNNIADADGLFWWASMVDPVGPDSEVFIEEFDHDHGGEFSYGHEGQSSYTLKGQVYGPNRTALKKGRERLLLATNLTKKLGTMTFEDYIVTTAQVYREDVKWRIVSNTMAEFEITMTAPDPRRYSTTEKNSPLAGQVTNLGNIDTWPWIQILNASAGLLSMTVAGGTVSINNGGAGNLVVDFKTRTATRNGVNIFQEVVKTSIWNPLDAGVSAVSYSGSGNASIFWRDAYR